MATKTSEFNFPKRADQSRVKAGVHFRIRDEFDQVWGKFTLTFMDRESVRGREQMVSMANRYRDLIDSGAMTVEAVGIKVLCENYIRDWEIPVEIWSEAGQPVPFSPEAAEKFLGQEETLWLANKLLDLAQNIRNFGYLTDVNGKPTDAKN